MNEYNTINDYQRGQDDVAEAAILKTPGSISSDGITKEGSVNEFFSNVLGSSENLLAKIEPPVLSIKSGLAGLLSIVTNKAGEFLNKTSAQNYLDKGIGKVSSTASTALGKVTDGVSNMGVFSGVSPLKSPLTDYQKKMGGAASLINKVSIPNSLQKLTNTQIFKDAQSSVTKTILSTPLPNNISGIAGATSSVYNNFESMSKLNNSALFAANIPGTITAEKILQNGSISQLPSDLEEKTNTLIEDLSSLVPTNPLLSYTNIKNSIEDKIYNITQLLDSGGENVEVDNLSARLAVIPDASLDKIKIAAESDHTLNVDAMCIASDIIINDSYAETFINVA